MGKIDLAHSPGSYGVLGPLVIILLCLAELVFEGAGQLVEQAHLLTVLKEAGWCGRLVWWRRGGGDGRKRHEQMTIQSSAFTLRSPSADLTPLNIECLQIQLVWITVTL